MAPRNKLNKRLVIFTVCGITAMLLAAGSPKTSTTNIAPDITVTTIARDRNHHGLDDAWTDVIKRGGARVAAITRSLTKSGTTNITSSFLVDNSIVLTTIDADGDGCFDKFFIQSPTSDNVEGFSRNATGGILPLPKSEIEKFKTEIKKFR